MKTEKDPILKTRKFALGLPLLTLAILVTAANGLFAQVVYTPNDWYSSGNANATSITGGGSATATINYGNTATATNAGNTALWSYFAPNATPATLLDGNTLTFTAGLSIDFFSASSRQVVLRFGVFDSSALRASTTSGAGVVDYGATRVLASPGASDPRKGWSGFITESVASGAGTIYERNFPNTDQYSTTGSGVTTSGLTSGLISRTFVDNVAQQLTLNLTRSGDDLTFSGSLGTGSFSGVFVGAFASGYPDTFDAFGFFMGSQGTGGTAANSLTFSNASVTVVPEPSSVALLTTSGIGFLVMLRRRRLAIKL